MGKPQIIHAQLGTGARILDLGCGTGRIAAPLVEFGHAVAGVDDSPGMLAAMDPRGGACAGDARAVGWTAPPRTESPRQRVSW